MGRAIFLGLFLEAKPCKFMDILFSEL